MAQAPYSRAMPNRRMLARSTALLAAMAVSVVGLALPARAGDAPAPIVVAVQAPLTGPQASNGVDMLRGVRLAARQANADGGVLGRAVRVLAIDDQADPARAMQAVRKARAAGAVAVVGPYNSSVGVISIPAYLKAGIVPLHMTSTNDTDGLGVTVQPKNDQVAPVESEYVLGLGATSVAMLVDPSTYTQGMADRLQAALVAKGVQVRSIPIVAGRGDYAAEVADALTGVPDLVYVSTYYPEGAAIAKSLVRSKLPTRCLMGLANVDPALVRQAGQVAAERCAYSGVPEAAELPGDSARRYVADYRRAFGANPGVWGAFTYDSANLLFDAMRAERSTGFRPVLDALRHTADVTGATGEITINPGTGNRVDVPVFIMRLDADGVFTPEAK